jgi:hypothetical protein
MRLKILVTIFLIIPTTVIGKDFLSPEEVKKEEREYIGFIQKHGKKVLELYRLPTGEDLSYWGVDRKTYFYKSPSATARQKAPFWTNGYFNDDEKLDYVYILFSKKDNSAHLFGFISFKEGYRSYRVSQADATMCVATDYYSTIEDKVKQAKNIKHIIQFYHLEGSGSIVYWNIHQNKLIFYKPPTPEFGHDQNKHETKEVIANILKYHLWFLSFPKSDNIDSQFTKGDYNCDGIQDFAAVLTEVKPFQKYANGTDWYRTYVFVFLNLDLPYNKYQPVFVRTDGNKPIGFSVKSIKTEKGHDLWLSLTRYSTTRYRWFPTGFQAIEHSAD